jgi:hypothetical protein
MNTHTASMRALGVAMFFTLSACSAGDADSKEKFAMDFHVSDEVSTKDIGFPRYAGSRPYREDREDSSAANIGLSTPVFGFNVVAMKLETSDRPEQVAAFYKEALAKYGTVVECSEKAHDNRKAEPEDKLTCDADESGKNNLVYKVGTENNQRIVAIEPHGHGTRFSLVRLDMRGER